MRKAKAHRASQTTGKKKAAISKQKQELVDKLSEIKIPEVILPKFSIPSDYFSNANVFSISDASIGYTEGEQHILKSVNLSLSAKERIATRGKNASGKSTLLRALCSHPSIARTGNWHLPQPNNIGYLAQHYRNLNNELTVIEQISEVRSDWRENDVRRHLSSFLFRKNEEVTNTIENLSGGERVRLSLCLIAARPPRLLILDEITNNLDIETKEHVIQVLREFPGNMVVVSHEDDFLNKIGIDHLYQIRNGTLA